jgi:HAE1 family hydrophobic/amphiphilic exporter-1
LNQIPDRRRSYDPQASLNAERGDRAQNIQVGLDKLSFPVGYKISQGGEAQQQNQTFGEIPQALGLSVLLMYMLMVALFESWSSR